MKALKALVIGLGLLILAGIALLIYGVSSKIGPHAAGTVPPPLSSPALSAFGSVAVALPDGAKIEQILATGDRLVVRVSSPAGTDLIILDPARGEIVGRFTLTAPTR